MPSATGDPPERGPRRAPGPPERTRVAVDAMGGDHAPEALVAGAVAAARELGTRVWLVGSEEVLTGSLRKHDTRDLCITIQHAPDLIRRDESPVVAVGRKPGCSVQVALGLLRSGTVDAVVSAGHSGALVVAALSIVGLVPGIERPAMATPIPAGAGSVLLLDAGANVDADPAQLVHFALMGSTYARVLWGIARPRVGLLSNGVEDSAGTETTRAASAALRTAPVHFVGHVEGDAVARATVDVVVCEGFVGDAVLKALRGLGEVTVDMLRDRFSSGVGTRVARLLAGRRLADVERRIGYRDSGGSPLLGIDGVAIAAPGSSGARAIRNAIQVAQDAARLEVSREIGATLRDLPILMAPGASRRRRVWEQLRGRLARIRERHEAAELGELRNAQGNERGT